MPDKDSGFKNIPGSEPDEKSRRIEQLEEELQRVKDERSEDRFMFVVVIIVLLDVVFFSVSPNFSGPVALLILELLILIPLAKRLGMEEISEMINAIIHRATKVFGDKSS